MAVRERGDGARQTRGRREEGRKVAVRMTCVGGVREHDETRNCDGMSATRGQTCEMMAGNLQSVSLQCYRGSIAPTIRRFEWSLWVL